MKKLILSAIILATMSTGFADTGKKIYETTCVACHGADGKGAVPGAANFTLAKGPLSKSDKVLIKHITEGYQSDGSPMPMPPKGGNMSLSADEVKSVLAYIRETFGAKKK